MKHSIWLVMIIFALACFFPMTATANGKGLGIAGSPHDFSDDLFESGNTSISEDWNFRNEICRVCHVPHDHGRNETLFTQGLLWNHALSEETYVMYGEKADADPGFIAFIDGAYDPEPTGIAKLCLGCHDGSVAINQFDKLGDGVKLGLDPGDPDFVDSVFIDDYESGFEIPGFDNILYGTHPISIVYDVSDTGLNPVNTTVRGAVTIADVLDQNGKVQCSSCHDVHDSDEAVGGTHLLRRSNNTTSGDSVASGLCLVCHDK